MKGASPSRVSVWRPPDTPSIMFGEPENDGKTHPSFTTRSVKLNTRIASYCSPIPSIHKTKKGLFCEACTQKEATKLIDLHFLTPL